jgi:hypothetical protein
MTIASLQACSNPRLAGINQFSLKQIGIDHDNLVSELAPSFSELPIDGYEKRRQQVEFLKHCLPSKKLELEKFMPEYFFSKASLTGIGDLLAFCSPQQLLQLESTGERRYRSIAKFEVVFRAGASISIKRVPADAFVQTTYSSRDLRQLPRFFAETKDEVAAHPYIQRFIRFAAQQTKELNTDLQKLTITLHQVCVRVGAASPFTLPDGIHQDGVDYVIPAVPVILQDVQVPVSTVCDKETRALVQARLGIGDGLFHDDRIYWHNVTPVIATAACGRRSTFGLDIKMAS